MVANIKKNFNSLDNHIVTFEYWGTHVIIHATYRLKDSVKEPLKFSFLKDGAITLKNTIVFTDGMYKADLRYCHILPMPTINNKLNNMDDVNNITYHRKNI